MNTKIIPVTTPPPPARPLFPAVFVDSCYGVHVLVTECRVTVLHDPSEVYKHVGYSWERNANDFVTSSCASWIRTDGPVTIQFNAP